MPSDVTADPPLPHSHGPACTCGETHDHRTVAHRAARALSVVAPVVACAFCPACLASYTKLLSLVGVGLALTEEQHTVLLTSALGVSIAASVWRARRAGRWSPFAGAFTGALLALVGHFCDRAWLEWSGTGIMIASAWYEGRIARRHRSPRVAGEEERVHADTRPRATDVISGAEEW